MAVTALNANNFTQVTVSAKSLVQFRGGIADVAATSSPASGDVVTFAAGDMFVAEKSFFARGSGNAVTLEL